MPVHVPSVADSVSPSVAVPPIVGIAVFTGGVGATSSVAAEDASASPAAFVAVTVTRIVPPTSLAVSS